jgi:hypothetical protein
MLSTVYFRTTIRPGGAVTRLEQKEKLTISELAHGVAAGDAKHLDALSDADLHGSKRPHGGQLTAATVVRHGLLHRENGSGRKGSTASTLY